ncbi:hypothetical protein D9758_008104 [Tetrapyrgos nigripes]|uniref:Ubiquitin-activating enzyme E1-like n=1 Tax=Tetrapyrgos nigripes TaxID=182062 RepID=A0A8H5GHH7_9AGAR|nr:hypothetical protein D9758_008104 [Tetrapyrgos nigripes]
MAKGRTTHAKVILGPELHERLSKTKVLLVGAGGIGCELLKNIVLTGFGSITLLDLDTIDLSNLNRQFLFRKKDVKQSKALVAAQTAAPFNPNVKITPIYANIKEPQFDVQWFSEFDIVLDALDNLDARRHVNMMCMAAQVPLVESGTAGYLGQVQPLVKDLTECFDCIPKPTPKTFPVCTIRSTPSQPIHCIVWSKSYLMGQLFGEDEDATGELDEAEKQGENAQEIATLRKEAQAFSAVRQALRSSSSKDSAAKMAFQKVFDSDICNLLSMADMWRHRAPPTPLNFDQIMDGSFVMKRVVPAPEPSANGHPPHGAAPVLVNGQSGKSGSNSKAESSGSSNSGAEGSNSKVALKDQKKLTLKENLELFVSSTNRLAARLQAGEETISFDKDDDDTLDFVTASSNLRSAAYGIEEKTRWEVKEMAGNIIPAIATTNAIVSGLIVLQALYPAFIYNSNPPFLSVLQHSLDRTPNVGFAETRIRESEREVSVYEDKRVLADPDWDDNNEKTLESLNVTKGKFLMIVDEDGEVATIAVAIGALPPNHPVDVPAFILPDPVPEPPKKAKPAVIISTPPKTSLKRSAPDDDILELEPTAKRQKSAMNQDISSPSKKRRLEEDGLIIMETADEKLEDDDVIVID